VEFSIPTTIAEPLGERLALLRGKTTGDTQPIEPITTRPGRMTAVDPLFLPARARGVSADCLLGATFRIDVERGPPERPRPRLVAADIADRQRRRKTWQQNVARYALPSSAKVRVEVAGRQVLRELLGDPTLRRVTGTG
jgi:hypothetical protein